MLTFVDEFSRAGILNEHYSKVKDDECTIRLEQIRREVLVNNEIAIIVRQFRELIAPTDLIKFDGNYVHLRIKPHSNSIGFMFGIIEDLKSRHPIREYSCRQSSLEMIFNSFAIEDRF